MVCVHHGKCRVGVTHSISQHLSQSAGISCTLTSLHKHALGSLPLISYLGTIANLDIQWAYNADKCSRSSNDSKHFAESIYKLDHLPV